jgi:hypothetical protein
VPYVVFTVRRILFSVIGVLTPFHVLGRGEVTLTSKSPPFLKPKRLEPQVVERGRIKTPFPKHLELFFIPETVLWSVTHVSMD